MDTNYSTERLIIRDFTIEDAPLLQEYLSEADLTKQTSAMPHPFPEGLALEYIEKYHKLKKEGTAIWLAITLKETNQLIGMVGLILKPEHKKTSIGYLIGKPFWGKGYATEAAKKMIEVGFKDLDLNRIGGTVYGDNVNSLKVMERLGLQREGMWRSDFIKWGEVRDVVFFGLLREEYEENVKKE